MLKSLRLRNFRCFEDHTIPLKRMSVLIGRNNAGKSTVVEALRLISLVASRAETLPYKPPPGWAEIPKREYGVAPSLKGLTENPYRIPFGS
jgi:hypothetical protein